MDQSTIKYTVHHFHTVSSTLDVASQTRWQHGDLIVAQQQSNGRGQRGNRWISAKGENLTFTLVIQPRHIPVNEQFVVSIITSLAVVDALAKVGVQAKIKWPNDIYVQEQKICGILIEHFLCSEFLDKSILGVGINIGQTQFDPQLPNPTSLAMLGTTTSNDEVLKLFCDAFADLYNLNHSALLDRYTGALYRREGLFPYHDANGDFNASIYNINPHSGVITLKDDNGSLRSYYFKQVEFR